MQNVPNTADHVIFDKLLWNTLIAYTKYINHLHHHQHASTTLFADDNPHTSQPASTVEDPISTTDTDCMRILQQNNATITDLSD
jgi:hypothetical protein